MMNQHPIAWKHAPRSLFVPVRFCLRCNRMVSKWHEHWTPERPKDRLSHPMIGPSDTDGVGSSDGSFIGEAENPDVSGS